MIAQHQVHGAGTQQQSEHRLMQDVAHDAHERPAFDRSQVVETFRLKACFGFALGETRSGHGRLRLSIDERRNATKPAQ